MGISAIAPARNAPRRCEKCCGVRAIDEAVILFDDSDPTRKSALTDTQQLPEKIAAIKRRGYVIWAENELAPDFRAKFDADRIPVVGVRHVRVWGIQVDDERAIPGHERTSMPDEEVWEVNLQARDGSRYEVSSEFVVPAPE